MQTSTCALGSGQVSVSYSLRDLVVIGDCEEAEELVSSADVQKKQQQKKKRKKKHPFDLFDDETRQGGNCGGLQVNSLRHVRSPSPPMHEEKEKGVL